jgi:integrase/recombinase XerD
VNERVQVIDPRESTIVVVWRRGHLSRGTIVNYFYGVRRFRKYCEKQELIETEQLTATGLERFLRAYAGPRLRGRRSARNSCTVAGNALHAWACALRDLGTPLPRRREKLTSPLPPLLTEYCKYRRVHNGVSEGTLKRDIETAGNFLEQLHSRTKSIERTTLTDVDAFVRNLTTRLAKRTVADSCSSLRAFLRFLQITGRLSADLAGAVIAPRYRIDEHPPRTLPWRDVQKILHSISSQAPGKRDFAIMLLLATYGLGAAEVLALRLDDLDWKAGVLRARRPKTNVPIELPLLPAIDLPRNSNNKASGEIRTLRVQT